MSIEPGFGGHLWKQKQPKDHRGDQDWIRANIAQADRWQDLYPGKIVSYKVHCQTHEYKDGKEIGCKIPKGAAIVCFHGVPKNDDLHPDHELRRIWEQQHAAQPR